MWKRAKKDLGKYPEVVVNAKDAEGRGVSVRQRTVAFDEATGSMPVSIPNALGAIAGPATLLGHFHDEKVWNMHTMSIKGTLEQRAGWKLWAANYVWTHLKSTPFGLDYVADSRVCSTQGGRTQRLPLELGHPPLSDVPEYPL